MTEKRRRRPLTRRGQCITLLCVPTLTTKTKKGRHYLYWVRSARVNGKPRIVEQVYLGPKDRVLQEIHDFYADKGNGPRTSPPVLKRVQLRRFAGPALLWSLAQEWDLAGLVDRHVPAAPTGVRTSLSVGQYLVLAALNRALSPRSKRGFEPWYRKTVLARLWPAKPWELTSQRFWDHMDLVEPTHLEAIQRDLLQRLGERLPLDSQCLLYDTTNYYTFINTFNERTELARRGRNKQKRMDLRQLSLSLAVDEATGFPLYHEVYEGNRVDVTQFGLFLPKLERLFRKDAQPPEHQYTLVFDKGNVSTANVEQLERSVFSYIGAVPLSWLPELAEVSLDEYEPLSLPGTQRLKVLRRRLPLLGAERTVLVTFSPNFFCEQRRTLNKLQQDAEEKLQALRQTVLTAAARGKPRKQSAVQRAMREATQKDRLREFFHCQYQPTGEQVTDLDWTWNRAEKRAVQRRDFGKTVLFTDRDQWTSERIVQAYRRQGRVEHLFRVTKSRRPGLWWPSYHWTDSKLRVHALYCHFALLLLCLVQRRLHEHGIQLSETEVLDRLNSIDEALIVYADGSSQRVVDDMDERQKEVFYPLGLDDIARQLGNTVL